MSEIKVITARETEYDVVRDTMRHDGKQVPGGCAGFVVHECTVLCHECYDATQYDDADMIMGWDEWDYPGYTCEDCNRWLDVRLLVYPNGPGSEVYDTLED